MTLLKHLPTAEVGPEWCECLRDGRIVTAPGLTTPLLLICPGSSFILNSPSSFQTHIELTASQDPPPQALLHINFLQTSEVQLPASHPKVSLLPGARYFISFIAPIDM